MGCDLIGLDIGCSRSLLLTGEFELQRRIGLFFHPLLGGRDPDAGLRDEVRLQRMCLVSEKVGERGGVVFGKEVAEDEARTGKSGKVFDPEGWVTSSSL